MKTTKYLLAAVLAGAVLTGCSKKDNNYNIAAVTALQMKPTASVSLVVQTTGQKPGGMLDWTMGTMTATQIQFDGVQLKGDVFDLAEYTGKTIKSIDILTPSSSTLGALAVPFDTYTRAFFAIKLAPGGVTSSTGLSNSLFLNGLFYPRNANTSAKTTIEPVPIQIIVNDPVLMKSVWLANLTLRQRNYSATFVIDVNNITLGIDEAMLNNAVRPYGVIYITKTTNQNLYGIVVRNLENHMMGLQMSAELMNSVNDINTNTPLNTKSESTSVNDINTNAALNGALE